MHVPTYAELRCVSNFTFLRGASQPEELVERAKQLAYTALAVADECSMAGIVRAHLAAKEHGLELLVGSQFQVDWGLAPSALSAAFNLTVLAINANGYGNPLRIHHQAAPRIRVGQLPPRHRRHHWATLAHGQGGEQPRCRC